MKKAILILGLLGLILFVGLYAKRKFYDPKQQIESAKTELKQLSENDEIKNGDLIFQTSMSGQSKAIQFATKSKYSHCGIIFSEKGQFYVLEAVKPVKTTALDKWIARGKNGHYIIKRLKNAEQVLTARTLEKMKSEGEKCKGKNYDLTFEWSDDKIYCSELIWKI
jgi:phage terminase large subunit-like protein